MAKPSYEDILNYPNLPTLPTVAIELLELTSDPNVKLKEIEKLVQSDQGLSIKVMRTVNSSFYGLAKPCSSIKRALAYLGLNAVKSLVLGFSLVDVTKSLKDCEEFDFEDFWRRSIYSATGARQLSLDIGIGDPDEAFACGMFQDMGMLASILVLKQDYAQVLAKAGARHRDLVPIEQKELGFTHSKVGAAMGTKWRLPEVMVESVGLHHDPDRSSKTHRDVVHLVALGGIASEILNDENPKQPTADLIAKARAWFDYDIKDLESLLTKITIASQDMAKMLDQRVGQAPDIQQTMSQAGEMVTALQIETQRQVDDLQRQQVDLTQKVETDAMTGIGNRAKFNDLIGQLQAKAGEHGSPFALLMIDADRFKAVNDTHGHQVGDAVLVELARRVSNTVGNTGTACRYGGEEFTVLLPDIDEANALERAERVRLVVGGTPFDLRHVAEGPDEIQITISIGVSICDPAPPAGTKNVEQIIAAADKALYRAKQEGRNRVCLESKAMRTESIQAPAQASSPALPELCVNPNNHHVLLFENDSLAATLLIALMKKKFGAKVSWIREGSGAIRCLQQMERGETPLPTMILSELHLPDLTALDIVRHVMQTKTLAHLPVHVYTATENDELLQACIEAGAVGGYRKSEIINALPIWVKQILVPPSTPRMAA
ncbi:MAG: HDOD domain-containing protein [Planctomycetota bacterium]|nr:HDOD domain-containing protein [Planctomycetota bacterium]